MNINAYQLTAAAAPAQGAPKARSANRTTVFLFDSRVRGDHRPDIDVDFAVFIDEWGSDNATTIVYWELRRRYGGSQMALSVRMMIAPEIDLICDYFENATTEHLETLGVDANMRNESSVCERAVPRYWHWQAIVHCRSRARARCWIADNPTRNCSSADRSSESLSFTRIFRTRAVLRLSC
jgi:hypothetical protein